MQRFDLSKRGQSLSEQNQLAEASRRKQEEVDYLSGYNPLNAAVKAAAAYFSSGGNIPIAVASALTAQGGQQLQPVQSALQGMSQGAAMSGLEKAVKEGKDLLQPSLIAASSFTESPKDILTTISTIAKNTDTIPEDLKSEIDVLGKIIQNPNSTKAALDFAEKRLSNVFNWKILPQVTELPPSKQPDQSENQNLQYPGLNVQQIGYRQDETGMPHRELQQKFLALPSRILESGPSVSQTDTTQVTPVSKISGSGFFQPNAKKEADIALAQAKVESMGAKTELAPVYSSLANDLSSAISSGDHGKVDELFKMASEQLKSSPELLLDFTKDVMSGRKQMTDNGFRMTAAEQRASQNEFNRVMRMTSAANSAAARETRVALKLQSDALKKEEKLEAIKMKNRSSREYLNAQDGLASINYAIEIYNKNPDVTNLMSGLSRKFGWGEAGDFLRAITDAKDLLMRARTGAAIANHEQGLYKQMIDPQWYNDPKNVNAKLAALQQLFARRMQQLENPNQVPKINLTEILQTNGVPFVPSTGKQIKQKNVQSAVKESTDDALLRKIQAIRSGKK